MNPRIKELAEQACYSKDFLAIGLPNNMEKFAELIVRECVRHFNEDYQRDFDINWREDLSKSIKKHFGVEK